LGRSLHIYPTATEPASLSQDTVEAHTPEPSAPPAPPAVSEVASPFYPQNSPAFVEVAQPLYTNSSTRVPHSATVPQELIRSDVPASSGDECVVCFDGPQSAVCVPCGHNAICMACASEIVNSTSQCPVCRVEIREIIKLYKV